VAKRYFAEHGVRYTDVNISADRRGLREMVATTGQYGVPVILVGEKAMVGWDAGEFQRLFGTAYRKR
jgi:glutaredoxin 3